MPDDPKREKIESLREEVRKILERENAVDDPSRVRVSTDIESVIPGAFEQTAHGPVFVAYADIDGASLYGLSRVSDFAEISCTHLAAVSGESWLADFRPHDAIFLDIETSAGRDAAGVFAFMTGLGFFEERTFRVRQIFLRDATEEAAGLDLLDRYLSTRSYLVTFNGRGFDVPLLADRMRMHGRDSPIAFMPHLDLLTPFRRIWRRAFEDCRLTTLERGIVGVRRVNDIPGVMIPEQYEEFRRDLDARKMRATFRHNFHDVASMAPLAARLALAAFHPEPENAALHPREALAIGKLHLKQGRTALAVSFLDAVRADQAEDAREIKRELSLVYKKIRAPEKAARLWREMIGDQASGPFDAFPYVELAKYLEREMKDLPEARRITELALSLCPAVLPAVMNDLSKRLERLNKIKR